jgi:hypothetical protein
MHPVNSVESSQFVCVSLPLPWSQYALRTGLGVRFQICIPSQINRSRHSHVHYLAGYQKVRLFRKGLIPVHKKDRISDSQVAAFWPIK